MYESTVAVTDRMITRIESCEGFDMDDVIVLYGTMSTYGG